MDDVLRQLSSLSEPIRVRLLRLLEREELGVGELAQITQVPQPTVSRHLKALKDGGWVRSRPEGPSNLFRLADLHDGAESLWTLVRDGVPPEGEDLRRLDAVVALRETDAAEFFERVAGQWEEVRRDLYGERFLVPALLSLIPHDWTVADLGCGSGLLLAELAPVARAVIGVDREPAMLDAAAERVGRSKNVRLVHADLTELPLPDATADAAILSLVLHFVDDVASVLREARRILKTGGRLVVLDNLPHDRSAYRQSMGHVHLGFSEEALRKLAARAGFALHAYRALPPDPHASGPGLFVAVLEPA